ncbi:MAG: type VI secretion system protein TssA [Thermoanaerobaculia bacterium]
MSAGPVIDFDAMLEPIPGENPAGENLQYAGLHDEIREARRAEDTLAQGDWQREVKAADWDRVIELSRDALTSKTKDLQIAAWLAEALLKKQGFTGLRDGLKLMRELHERFWEGVYPPVEDGDQEARANSLAWLDEKSALALQEVAITRAPGAAYSFLEMEDAKKLDLPANAASLEPEELERRNQERERALSEGRPSTETFTKARNATRRAFYEETAGLLAQCRQETQALDRVMDEKFGRETPGLGGLKKSLDVVGSWVEKTVKEKRIEEPDASDLSAETSGEEGAAGAAPGASGGPIKTRQDALRRLAEVADFFRRTEPHSPVSYLVQRAIGWGRMPLDAWLGDVIKDGALLDSIRETLGLKTSGGDTTE